MSDMMISTVMRGMNAAEVRTPAEAMADEIAAFKSTVAHGIGI